MLKSCHGIEKKKNVHQSVKRQKRPDFHTVMFFVLALACGLAPGGAQEVTGGRSRPSRVREVDVVES